jgi:tRNA1(Val) A37 N6-methylase TrmN6
MPVSTRAKNSTPQMAETEVFDASAWLPPEIGKITNHQTDLPRIAKDPKAIAAIESQLSQIPTTHDIYNQDARRIDFLAPNSVHLVVTSPPYWTLKDYREHPDQMGFIAD